MDASGRFSAIPHWLEEIGFSTPQEFVVDPKVSYSNPTEIFGLCMNEASYIECSAFVLRALCACATDYPEIASDAVAVAIGRTIQFL